MLEVPVRIENSERSTVNVARDAAHEAPGDALQLDQHRALLLQQLDGQWGRAKGFDTFCPVGPRVAEGLDWRELELICRLNGAEAICSYDRHFDAIRGIRRIEPGS